MSDQEQLTPQQERAYVDAAWENFYTTFDEVGWCAVFGPHRTAAYITEKSAIRAASLYTKEHERKIAEVWEEIFEIKEEIEGYFQDHRLRVILERILAREEAALADLLRGWREKGDGNGRG